MPIQAEPLHAEGEVLAAFLPSTSGCELRVAHDLQFVGKHEAHTGFAIRALSFFSCFLQHGELVFARDA